MRRGRDLIGAPVVETGTGRILGTIADLLFRSDGTLSAFLVEPARGVLRRAFSVPVERFDSIREGRALIDGAVFRRRQKKAAADGVPARSEPGGLCGKALVTCEGKELGTIADVVLDGPGVGPDGTGPARSAPIVLWGFEVSDGIVKDLLDGRAVVEAAGARFDGTRVVLDKAARHMNLTAGGHATREGSE